MHTKNPIGNNAAVIDAARGYLRIVAVINGVILIPGILTPLYVYLHFPHSALVQHFSEPDGSIEAYLFGMPAMQFVLFIGLSYLAVFWRQTVRRAAEREAWIRANKPRLRIYHSITVMKFVSIFFVLFGLLLVSLTIHHSLLVAAGGV
jgi:hypothetical protein